jgi:hypothetical protein
MGDRHGAAARPHQGVPPAQLDLALDTHTRLNIIRRFLLGFGHLINGAISI